MSRGSRLSAVGARRDYLSERLLSGVARGEESGSLCAHLVVCYEIAVIVKLGKRAEEIVVGDESDSLKHAVYLYVCLVARVDILDLERVD